MKVGLDTVTAIFRVQRADLSGLEDGKQSRTTDLKTGDISTTEWATLASGLRVRTQATHDGGQRLLVEGSLPKAARGTNLEALELGDYSEVMRGIVIPQLRDISTGLEESDWNHSRVDTLTDLDCDESFMSPVLRGLEAVPVRKGLRRSLLRSTLERPETLMVQNGAGAMRGYDKGLEHFLKNGSAFREKCSDKLRVEGQSRRDWLKAAGVRTGRDLETFPGNVIALHERRIKWAGFDREVVSDVTAMEVLDAYCREAGHGQRVADSVMGYLLRCAHGLPVHAARGTIVKYKRIAREAGVQPADVLQRSIGQVSYRLDFESGKVERRVA